MSTPLYLLDTNVVSEFMKKRPSEAVVERVCALPAECLATSVVCLTELRYGAARHPNGEALWRRIAREILPQLRILPLGTREALRAGDLLARLESAGTPIGIEDVMIAATAFEHGATVVTRNLKHFSRVEHLRVESWWS